MSDMNTDPFWHKEKRLKLFKSFKVKKKKKKKKEAITPSVALALCISRHVGFCNPRLLAAKYMNHVFKKSLWLTADRNNIKRAKGFRQCMYSLQTSPMKVNPL